jgi:DNA-binding NtrC family response regulator
MSSQTNPLKVAIVDDEDRLRDILLREIKAMGHTATGYRSAEAAWDALQESATDAILLDLNLPGMDGMELFQKIREGGLDIAVVILTGFGELDSAVQSLRWEADDYLTKPCSLGEIERVLARIDERKRSRRREQRLRETALADQPGEDPASPQPSVQHARRLEEVEREHIVAALKECNGNKTAAAKRLGISLRTLYNRLQAYRQQGRFP